MVKEKYCNTISSRPNIDIDNFSNQYPTLYMCFKINTALTGDLCEVSL